MPSPVLVPRVRPGTSSPGGGGTNPKMPDCHARSPWPSSPNCATKLEMAFTFVVAPSSALHADGFAANMEIAPPVAPRVCMTVHWSVARLASVASAVASTDRYTSIGPDPTQTLSVGGTSADWRIAAVGRVWGDGPAIGLKAGCVSLWHARTESKTRIADTN